MHLILLSENFSINVDSTIEMFMITNAGFKIQKHRNSSASLYLASCILYLIYVS